MESKWKVFLERIKSGGKLPGKNQLLLVFLVGLLLLVIAYPVSDKDKEVAQAETATDANRGSRAGSDIEAYQEYMEKRVANALESVAGVGKAEVVITLKSSGEKVIEKDKNSSHQVSSEQSESGSTRTTEDRTSDSTSVYTQQSDGSQTPYVSKELTPEISGVVVIADGGDNAVVVQNITEAIQALFGVETHKIKIMKRTDT